MLKALTRNVRKKNIAVDIVRSILLRKNKIDLFKNYLRQLQNMNGLLNHVKFYVIRYLKLEVIYTLLRR